MLGKLLLIQVFFLFVGSFYSSVSEAEPWLGSRFAQNCSGCHSPQRINVAPKSRRCSLSCQGCHTNPNGGGLRSFYGKWNGNRWLKSFRSDTLGHKKNVASFKKQKYAKRPYKKGVASKRVIMNQGIPLVEQEKRMKESLYDRRYGREKTIAANKAEYLYSVPEGDPWRQMAETKYNAGADARWLLTSTKTKTDGDTTDDGTKSFLMSIDYGIEYRPVYRKFHLVYESRISGTPVKSTTTEETLTSSIGTRSLYALVDDLPWNIFVMAGYYRPLFGNQVPDHNALSQKMQSIILSESPAAQRLNFNAISMGTAPNVPYFNLHVIQKRVGDPDDKTIGFGTNFGLRFVTLGLSLNYSYWRTEDDRGDLGLTDIAMHSIGFALKVKRTTATYEGVSFTRDSATDFREGGVHTVDTYTQVWREIYFLLNFATANTSVSVTSGTARQYNAGVRAFLYPGVDFSILYGSELNDDFVTKQKTDRSGITSQMHMYF